MKKPIVYTLIAIGLLYGQFYVMDIIPMFAWYLPPTVVVIFLSVVAMTFIAIIHWFKYFDGRRK